MRSVRRATRKGLAFLQGTSIVRSMRRVVLEEQSFLDGIPALGKARGAAYYKWFPKGELTTAASFNGQPFRQQMFDEIVMRCAPAYIVETGTYLGITTVKLATYDLPVYSTELSAFHYGFARKHLAGHPTVHLELLDSRHFLRRLLKTQPPIHHGPGLFYLDAHWGKDLPLGEEIEIIFGNRPDSVVVVDDFQVPHDSGYGYDDYGLGKALNLVYLAPQIEQFGLSAFFPKCPANEEGGARRGSVVLATHSNDVLPSCHTLQKLGEDRG